MYVGTHADLAVPRVLLPNRKVPTLVVEALENLEEGYIPKKRRSHRDQGSLDRRLRAQ
jgi:hypothetical protein